MAFTEYWRAHAQTILDELVDDTIVLKLHDGPPGPQCTENLLFGDGLPQEYTFSKGGQVSFVIPAWRTNTNPVKRKWWQPRRQHPYVYQPTTVEIHEISMWSRGIALMLLDLDRSPIWLTPGFGTLTLTDIGKPTIK